MSDRTWIGGKAGNKASSAANWSPNGTPQPGDTLTTDHGMMKVTGDTLSGDVLTMRGNSQIDLTNTTGLSIHTYLASSGPLGGEVTVNAHGNNHVDVTTAPGRGFGSSVTIHNSGTLTGSIGGYGTNFTLTGGKFYNVNSTAGFDGENTVINADVLGTGKYSVGTFHASSGGLRFMQSVGAGQTVQMQDGLGGHSTLTVDKPGQFKAAVDWETGNGVIDLNKLAADSYRYHDGVIDFFHGDKVVDTLRFSSAHPELTPFSIAQGTSTGGRGIEIYSTAGPLHGFAAPHGADLPIHGVAVA
jgi:hypothetical protein